MNRINKEEQMNNIDNQSTDLIGDAYKNFEKQFGVDKEDIESFILKRKMIEESLFPDKNEFIRLIKTDEEFAKTWGVKVEVRELSLDERYVLANINGSKEKLTGEPNYTEEQQHSMLDELVPTKAISLTYDNRTEVIYE
jgi:hypothetical protein